MALYKRCFPISENKFFECSIFKIDDTFWFKGCEIAEFLGYARPNKAILDHVKPRHKKTLQELCSSIPNFDYSTVDPNAKPDTEYIDEAALYSMLLRANTPYTEPFAEWVSADILVTLRRDGLYTLNAELARRNGEIENLANGLLDATKALTDANTNLTTLSQQLVSITQDVVVKPRSPELLHAMSVHQVKNADCNTFIFTRRQRTSINPALKRLQTKNPCAKEIYRINYVPNGVNVLNCVKDVLRDSKIIFASQNNVIHVDPTMEAEQMVEYLHKINRKPSELQLPVANASVPE